MSHPDSISASLADLYDKGFKSGYEAGKKDGVEAGLRRASEICQLEKVDAESTNEDADGAYNLAITHCTETILSAIGGYK